MDEELPGVGEEEISEEAAAAAAAAATLGGMSKLILIARYLERCSI